MNKFLLKILKLFSIVCVLYLLLGFLADGKTDPFYLRFTTPKKNSLVIGTSRAAQGIIPEVFTNSVNTSIYEGNMFNYSFTINHSPFGEVYLKAIKSKVDQKTKNGLFIVSVDPWSISTINNNNLRETNLELGVIENYNSYPNYNYLRKAYSKSFFNIILDKFNPDERVTLHENGWLEISLTYNKEKFNKGATEKLTYYKEELLPKYKISPYRIEYLEKTITYLKKFGKVVLIRLPIDDRMQLIEEQLDKNFNERVLRIANKHNVNYRVYDNKDYIFPDGNHLFKESGKKFTKRLAKDINKLFLNE